MESRASLERTLRVSKIASRVNFAFVAVVSAWNAYPVYRNVLVHGPQTEITRPVLRSLLFFAAVIPWVFFEILRKRTEAVLKSLEDKS